MYVFRIDIRTYHHARLSQSSISLFAFNTQSSVVIGKLKSLGIFLFILFLFWDDDDDDYEYDDGDDESETVREIEIDVTVGGEKPKKKSTPNSQAPQVPTLLLPIFN